MTAAATPFIHAIILGILEGLTEFIPVSSTGHLIIVGELLAFDEKYSATFDIFIQLGAILSVVVIYFERFLKLIPNYNASDYEDGFSGYTGLSKIALACIPAFVLGFLFHDIIKQLLFNPTTVALALIVGGIAFFVFDKPNRSYTQHSLESISYKQSLYIGLWQCLALWPGMSRSGSTIIGGLIQGLDRKIAAEFSFFVAVPVMVAAVSYDMLKSMSEIDAIDWSLFAVGFITSFLIALLAIKTFLTFLNSHTLRPFGVYRILLGIVVLIYHY